MVKEEFALGAVAIVLGYLLGSIPGAYIAARLHSGVDLRRVGSGNIGAMNVIRNVSPIAGLFGGAFDASKAAVAVLAAGWLGASEWAVPLAALAAIAGHDWSIWCRWSGGKGLAASLGALVVLYPAALPWLLVVIAVAALVSRDMMLAVAVTMALAPVVLWLVTGSVLAGAFGLGMAVMTEIKLMPDIRAFTAGRRRLL